MKNRPFQLTDNESVESCVACERVKKEDANIQQCATAKSLLGLYLIIREEEKRTRRDPVGTGGAILQEVFGALKSGHQQG